MNKGKVKLDGRLARLANFTHPARKKALYASRIKIVWSLDPCCMKRVYTLFSGCLRWNNGDTTLFYSGKKIEVSSKEWMRAFGRTLGGEGDRGGAAGRGSLHN